MTDPRDLIKRLADALHDAADDVEGWGNYASSYFQEKHDLSGNVAKIHAQADEARAYLDQPEPEGPTDEELQTLLYYEFTTSTGHGERSDPIGFARAVLTRWGRPLIEPVPVSERPWEREGWCDGDGWCWGFDAEDTDPYWSFDKPEGCPTWTHLLPHDALPVPTQHS